MDTALRILEAFQKAVDRFFNAIYYPLIIGGPLYFLCRWLW